MERLSLRSTRVQRVPFPIPQQSLDFLRGAAAVYVVINHSRGAFYVGGEKILAGSPSLIDRLSIAALQLTSLGTGAVILFFVLSGFAMAHSVSLSNSTPRFYLKRLIRIWPPYIAACLFASAVAVVTGIKGPHLLSAILYIDTNSAFTPQFWSLPFEVIFYLLCPIVLRNRLAAHAFFVVAAVALAVTVVTRGWLMNPFHHLIPDFIGNEAFFFAVGGLAYHHLSRIPAISGRWLVAAVAACFAAAWLSVRIIGDNNIFMCFAIMGMACILIRNLPASLAQSRSNIGHFSYSIYLYHYAIIAAAVAVSRAWGIDPSEIRNPVAWIALVPLAVGVSFLLYLVTEKQSNRVVTLLRNTGSPRADLAKAD